MYLCVCTAMIPICVHVCGGLMQLLNKFYKCNDFFTELAEDEDQFSFKIVFHGPGNRSYILGSDSQESMEQWMKALACASYDYMKLMVAELQRQLDEMEGKHVKYMHYSGVF